MENYTSSDVPVSASCGRSAAEEAIWLFDVVLAAAFCDRSLRDASATETGDGAERARALTLPCLRGERKRRREKYK